MKNKASRKLILYLTLILFVINIISSTLLFLQNNTIKYNELKKFQDNKQDFENNFKSNLGLSSIKEAHEGSGGLLNVSIHQSLINNTKVEITNTSDTNNITFYEKCPSDSNFNSSFINITLEDIKAYNKSVIFEDYITDSEDLYNTKFAASFQIEGTGYLDNISVYLWNDNDASSSSIKLQIYKSKWNETESWSEPNRQYGNDLATGVSINNYNDWYNFADLDMLLNASKTENNTFFVVLIDIGDDTNWYYDYDSDPGSQDDSDDIDCFEESGGPDEWIMIIKSASRRVDFSLKCGFFPLNNTPNPEDISLKINNTEVTGYSNLNGSGYWNSTEEYSSASGNLSFEISADWWDVSCNITKVLINYTKSDITANSKFNISENNQKIIWNVTIGENIDDFETDFNNKYINFTIPSSWTLIQAYFGATEKSNTTWDHGDGWQIVKTWEGENGNFWGLNASTLNLISSIGILVGGIPKTTVKSSDTVSFNATFSENVEGEVNLSVYSPSQISDFINYTYVNDTATASVVNLSNWIVSDNVTEYGVFRIRVFWNNNTAAGFYKVNLTILGETDLNIDSPLPNSVYDSDEIFNITITYKDTEQDVGISGANIEYKINGGSWTSSNVIDLGNGKYNITINCSKSDFDGYGDFSVQINASKIFYNNKSKSLDFKILGKTSFIINFPPDNSDYDSGDTFDIEVAYTDSVKTQGIIGATIRYSLDGGSSYRSDNIVDNGDGTYNITINCADSDFNDYGWKNMIVNASLQYYYNKSDTINIKIIGETTFAINYPPDNSEFDSGDTFDIEVAYTDSVKAQGIIGATIRYSLDGGTSYRSDNIVDKGDGTYNITINCANADFNGYGWKNIIVNASLQYYYNKSDNFNIKILGETSFSINYPPDNSEFDSGDSFDIKIAYTDSAKAQGITGATIRYSLDGGSSYRSDNIVDNGDGTYNITINCADADFNGYGWKNIIVNASLQYYYNKSDNFDIKITGETTLTINFPPDNSEFDSGDTFDIEIVYTDSVKAQGIIGATIRYSLDGGSTYRSDNIVDNGEGTYNITINCADIDFSGYGWKIIIVNASLQYYYNKSNNFDIKITGETTFTINFPPDNSEFDSGDSFDIKIAYTDSVKAQGITGATIRYSLDGGGTYRSDNIIDNGDGTYNITINCVDSDFNGYGWKNIIVNASLHYYYNKSDNFNIKITGETTFTINFPPDNSEFDSGDIFDIEVVYTDSVKAQGITGAAIRYSLDGGSSYRSDNIVDNGDGTYNITINCVDSDFNGYGWKNIIVNASLQYYYNKSDNFDIKITGETTFTINFPPNNSEFDSGDAFDIEVVYTDGVKAQGITGAAIRYSLDGGGIYRSDNIVDNGDGTYNITINCNDADFNGYGWKNIIVNASLQYHYNKSDNFNIKILGETTFIINFPPDNSEFDSGDAFDIEVVYTDSVKAQGIMGATIRYSLDGGSTYRSDNIVDNGDGTYNITINCADSDFNGYGWKNIIVNASLQYYYNKSDNFDIKIIGMTTFVINYPPDNSEFDSGDTFDIEVVYTDSIKAQGIIGATIRYSLNGGSTYRSDNIVDNGDGTYNITINCADSDFNGYGWKNIIVNASLQYYYNKSDNFDIKIIGMTTFAINYPPDNSEFDSGDTFDIEVVYTDSIKAQGIIGATIRYSLNGGSTYRSDNIVDNGDGTYNITINCADSDFNGYGWKNIIVNANLQFYYNKSDSINIKIIGETTFTINFPPDNSEFDSGDIFDIEVAYTDSLKTQGITGATIRYSLNGGSSYRSDNIVDNGDGTYNITINCADADFNGYGWKNIIVNASLQFYYNKSDSINIKIIGETTFTINFPPDNSEFDSGDSFDIEVAYTDSVKTQGITGATMRYSLDGGSSYRSDNIVDNGDGTYNITINCADSDFNGYGWKNIIVNASLQFYYNKSDIFSIKITGETELIILNPPENSSYNSGNIFNITVYYNDTVKDQGIAGATIDVEIKGSIYFTDWFDYGNGLYNITINCSKSIFDGYGWFLIGVNTSRMYYFNQSDVLNIKVISLTNYVLINLTQYNQLVILNGTTFNDPFEAFQGENITVYMYFNNTVLNKLISGAIGNLTFNGINYLNYSDINGLYSWEIDTSQLNPGQYSFFISFNKTYYQNQTATYYFDINFIHTNITIDIVYDDSGELDPLYENGYPIYTSIGDSNVTIWVTFWDVNHSYEIDGANGNLTVIDAEGPLFNNTDLNGQAWFTLNSSGYEAGDYKMNIFFWKNNYFQSVIWLNLSIVQYETNASILAFNQTGGLTTVQYNGTHWVLYRNYNTTFVVEYMNVNDNIGVLGAQVRLTFTLGGSTIFDEVEETNPSGQCTFAVPTHIYLTGIYTFTFTFSKDDYKTRVISNFTALIYIPTNGSFYNITQQDHITGQPTTLWYNSSSMAYEGLMSYNTTIYFTFWDKLNEEWINDGANCSLYFNGFYYYNYSSVIDGNYSWIIPTYNVYGTFLIKITMSKFNWANVTYEFYLTINPISTNLSLIAITPSEIYSVYYSDDILNITVFYNDTIKDVPIEGATIQYSLNGGAYSSANIYPLAQPGYYNISINCSEFTIWGDQYIIINASKFFYETSSLRFDFTVIGLTNLLITQPQQNLNFNSTNYFNITIFYNDTIKDAGIGGAIIEYDYGAGYQSTNWFDYGNGYYKITIYNWQVREIAYGLINIRINASRIYYINQSRLYNYYLWNVTMQSIDDNYQDIVRGANITFIANYMWNDSTPIVGAQLIITSIDGNFIYFWEDNGDGSYNLILNTSKVIGKGANVYEINFNISSFYNITQEYTIYLEIWNRTSIVINGLNQTIYSHYLELEPWFIYYGQEVTINLSYIDIDNFNTLLSNAHGNLTIFNLTVQQGVPVLVYSDINGYYYFTLSTANLYEGIYNIHYNFNLTYYNNSIGIFQLEIKACNSTSTIINLIQKGVILTYNGTGYQALYGSNVTVLLNYSNYYTNQLITGAIGVLNFDGRDYYDYDFDVNGIYEWEIDVASLDVSYNLPITITLSKINFQTQITPTTLDVNIIHTNITINMVFDESGNLNYTGSGYRIYTSMGESNVTIVITFWDINNSYTIDGANGNLTVKGKEFLINTTETGVCWFILNSSGYGAGSYLINITFWKANYLQSVISFNLSIVSYETNSSILAVNQTGGLTTVYFNGTHYIIYRNYNTIFLVQYWNEDDNMPVINGDGTFDLIFSGLTKYSVSEITNSSGQCKFIIPTHNMPMGIYDFTITFIKDDYEIALIQGKISIIYISTSGSLENINQPEHTGFTDQLMFDTESGSYLGWLPYNTTIEFSFWDIINSEWINDGIGILNFNGQNYYDYIGQNGIYVWEISTYNLVGYQLISIIMMKDNWENVSFQFYLTMSYKGLEISDLIVSDYGHELEIQGGIISGAYIGNDLVIQLKLKDNITGYYINQSNVILKIDDIIYEINIIGGTYYLIFSTGDFVAQTYNIYISFAEDYYVNRSILYSIEFLEKYVINISLEDVPDSIRIGETLSISIKLIFVSLNPSLLQMSADFPIFGENISLIFNFGGGLALQTITGITNIDGIASYNIIIPEGAEFVNITVVYEGNYQYNGASLSFAISLSKAPPIDNLFLIFLVLAIIAIGAVGIIGIIIIKKHRKGVEPIEEKDIKSKEKDEKISTKIITTEEIKEKEKKPEAKPDKIEETEKDKVKEKPIDRKISPIEEQEKHVLKNEERIEKLVFKVLKENQDVKVLKRDLIENTLKGAREAEIPTTREKIRKIIIQFRNEDKIVFDLKEGWKIKN